MVKLICRDSSVQEHRRVQTKVAAGKGESSFAGKTGDPPPGGRAESGDGNNAGQRSKPLQKQSRLSKDPEGILPVRNWEILSV